MNEDVQRRVWRFIDLLRLLPEDVLRTIYGMCAHGPFGHSVRRYRGDSGECVQDIYSGQWNAAGRPHGRGSMLTRHVPRTSVEHGWILNTLLCARRSFVSTERLSSP